MKLLAYILTFLLFIGPVVLAVMGWHVIGFGDKATKLLPSFYIIIVAVSISFLRGDLNYRKCKYALLIIALSFFWFFVCRVTGREANKNILFQCMALPALYFVFYELLKESHINRIGIRNLIILMFVFNSLMAIYERLTLYLFFPYDLIASNFNYTLDDKVIFRSSALLGHPLMYAHLMTIVMVFILISNLNNIIKYFLYFIGIIGLFCTNSRAAIMISIGILVLYLIHLLFKKGTSWSKRILSFMLLCLFFILVQYLFNSGYGGRFEERGAFKEDGSALARINVFDIISHYGLSSFWWGLPYKDVENMAMIILGMTHIENWFILSTMVVGLVLTTIVTLLFIPIYRQSIRPYEMYSALLIFLAVIVLGSTNNSFATGTPALSVFFACCYAFSPHRFEKKKKRECDSCRRQRYRLRCI